MTAQTKPASATYADIEALPQHVAGQIVYGALHTHRPGSPRHVHAASRLCGELMGIGDAQYVIFPKVEIRWNGHVIVPDIACWHRERMISLPDTAYLETVPDWICEVLCPSTNRLDRVEKRALYAEMGVMHLWHIDPAAQTLEAFELKDGAWMLLGSRGSGDTCDLLPFDAVPFALDLLWTL